MVAKRTVLDTSTYSRMRANHTAAIEWLAATETIYVPAVVLGELEAGFRMGRRLTENRVALAEFLAEPYVTVLPVTSEVARRYGQVVAELRTRGTPIPSNDVWIAATALDVGAHVLTFDRDLERVHQLEVTVLTP